MKARFAVQHEMDFEPTYVIDTQQDVDDGGKVVAEFPPVLLPKVRLTMARRLAKELNDFAGKLFPDNA